MGKRSGMVYVAGGVNIDIGGQAAAPLVPRDSNPGRVRISLGGVGRNIAHNLRLLGVPVSLLTALGEDAYAQEVRSSCRTLGIQLDAALEVPEGRTSTYLFLSDQEGEMVLAVSDMEIYERLTPEYFAQHISRLNQGALAAADTNLPQASLAYLARNCTVPLFVDPVSVGKAEKLRGILGRIHTLKPNRLEAEALSGVPIGEDGESLERGVKALLELGVERVFLTLGPKGIYAAQGEQRLFLPPPPTKMHSATGGGDAFTAGLIWAFLEGKDFEESARVASAAASLAVEGAETINPALSPQAVERRIREQKEEEK